VWAALGDDWSLITDDAATEAQLGPFLGRGVSVVQA
jgi:hypothetical protein